MSSDFRKKTTLVPNLGICVRASDRMCLRYEQRRGDHFRFAENVYCTLPCFVVYSIVTYYAYTKRETYMTTNLVSRAYCPTYDAYAAHAALTGLLAAISVREADIRGRRILIKPNLVMAKKP